MKEKIKKKGFVQIPILIVIIVSVLVVGGVGFGFVEYKQVSDKIIQAKHFLEIESYDKAISNLADARTSWLVTSIKIKNTQIQKELQEAEIRQGHRNIYKEGLDAFDEVSWEEAIVSFSEIPKGSFYYHQA
jgi:flagellar basal body-associated protein FliL